ncbi:cyclophilin-like domain-containing protein [Phanerochaete sordida]|uniref:Peptidyl-prolyl cis-trans isomerase D n=1 Tax=Phanerochaete sordida TaxID=48140 RepID=A0A9P3FYN7_9APHY|nr:cyclophilin-like domain-containing protein [Phanerochaete sordida]
MVKPRVFFDISIDNSPVGRIIFELYNDTAPKTSENFRALCTGEKGLSPLSDRPLYYKNSIIHRSIKDFMIQGGDFTKRNGSGGESIYGGTFPDEDLTRPIDSEGLLCMANRGPNTNGSQFFVTLRECPHLNGKHVVFGRVVRGYEVVQKIAELPVDEKDRPQVPVTVANCGELVLRKQVSEEPRREKSRAASDAGSGSESEGESRKHKHKKRRHKKRHSSRSGDEDSDSEERRHRKHKRSKHKDRADSPKRGEADKRDGVPREETEAEYDARLEREEKERLEAEKRKELERLKQIAEAEVPTRNGVRFKGRGRMKYVDPELRRD